MPRAQHSPGRAAHTPSAGQTRAPGRTALQRLPLGTAGALALAVWLGCSPARGESDFGTRSLSAFSFAHLPFRNETGGPNALASAHGGPTS